MVARIKTVSFRGVDVLDIDVEVQISSGFVAFTNVGYIIGRFKLYFLLMMTIGLFYSQTSMANDASVETLLKCGDTTSRIISVCDNDKLTSCSSQKWEISDKDIDLKNSQAAGFHAHEWACLPSKEGYKIIFYFITWGNCDTCERLSIWDLNGHRIADWKEFESIYKKLNFSHVTGQEFHNQFNRIKLRN